MCIQINSIAARCFFSATLLFSFVSVDAQKKTIPVTNDEIIENFIEEISANTDRELDFTTLYEDLTYYLNEPLNINTATKQELEKLQILSDFQINAILQYIKDYGEFLTVYELINIHGFNEEFVKILLPFITVKSEKPVAGFSPSKALRYGRHKVFFRWHRVLEQQQGYMPASDSLLSASPNSRYLGNPGRYYFRYAFGYKSKLMWGITAEKDPGEEFFKGTQKQGFDFYSAHILIKDIGPVKTLTLGDYYAQFGQGLVVFSGYNFGKSSLVTNVRKKAQGLKKYSSADENLFFRGSGVTLSLKPLDVTVFISRKKIDANISKTDSLTGIAEEASSLQTSGEHSYPSLVDDRKALQETVAGTNITLNSKKFRAGLTGIHYFYDTEITKNINVYNQFEFSGKENSVAGADCQVAFKDIIFFGEGAVSQNNGKAFLGGMIMNLSPQVDMSVIYRNYERNFQNYFSNAFGENTSNANEKGVYIGTTIYPYTRWRLSAYYDLYSFPWLRYGAYSPTGGYDYFIEAAYSLNRRVNMYLRFKQENKSENIPSSIASVTDVTQDVMTTKTRFHISNRVSNSVELRNRIEWLKYEKDKTEYGFLIYQYIIYRPVRLPVSFSAGYCIFDTDGYDSRLYVYENDVLYAFSVPMLYNKGNRWFFNVRYEAGENLTFWLKIGQTYYSDINTISSGLTQIDGNTKTDIKIQARYVF